MSGGQLRRDRWGIPHLRAGDADALAFLQGLATARDRSWQLDVERRRSEGTLAAVVGRGALDWDVLARRAGLDALARSAYRSLDHPTRRWVRAYVRGVNQGLAEPRAGLAGEFVATGTAPEPWRPWTPLGVLAVQHLLFGSFPHKLWHAHVRASLGEEAAALLGTESDALSGSNAWAIPGTATASGAPLLAGDPHRLIEAPGVYQQVHLTCPEFDVVGLAFAGVPGVQHFGHTGGVAWAVTNAMADDQDLYVETLRRDGDRLLVRQDGGWIGVPAHEESVAVRGGAPVTVEVVRTPRGPLVLGGPGRGDAEGTGLALRTPARVLGDLGLAAVPLLLRARDVADVETALQHWVEPVNSVLVADTTGRIRRLVAGRVPARDARNRLGPVPGDDPAHAWAGWVALAAADAGGLAVAANDRRPFDTAELGSRFAPGHRARRIHDLLAGRAGLTVQDCRAVHIDTHLGVAPALQRLLAGLDPAALPGPAQALRKRILRWDARMAAADAGAEAFATWRDALVRRLAADPALAPLHRPHGHPELFAPWLDVIRQVATSLEALVGHGHRLGLDVRAAAGQALVEAGGASTRGWGERHVLAPVHALDGAPGAPLLPTVGMGGDTDCVLATSSLPGVTAACSRGPVARYVWDLADRSRSVWVVPLGASGRWGGPHALDQLPVYAAGHLVPVGTGPGETVLEESFREVLGGPASGVLHEHLVPGLGLVTIHRFDPDADAAVVHPWVVEDRARFWGMQGFDIEDVQEIYAVVDVLAGHDARLMRVNGTPFALVQVYDPAHDPVGEVYPVRAGDVGLHLLLAPRSVPGIAAGYVRALAAYLFGDLGARRVIAEPDARNAVAITRLAALGFELGEEVELPAKRARLAFLPLESVPAALLPAEVRLPMITS